MISILICTYKRPVLLRNCIDSVLSQNYSLKFEVIVVDNDEDRTAEGVVLSYGSRVRYFSQPLKGLSHARNMAVSKASGEFVLFIDDDEYADISWLDRIVDCQKKYDADVVLGKVVYEIPDSFPSYIRGSSYFFREPRVTGSRASWNEGYTGNTLVRKKLFELRTPPFLIEYNHTGGEDSDFFNFLLKNNVLIVFCNEAVIYEIQDEKRLKKNWYFIRGYRGGYLFSKKTLEDSGAAMGSLIIAKSVTGGGIISLCLLVKCVFNFNRNFLSFVSKFAGQLGKVGYLVGLKMDEYV